jgi:hypothetical protein
MNQIFMAIATLTAALSAIAPALAQQVPALRQEMPYAQARERILDAGWQAVFIPPLQRGYELSGTEARMINELGYGEMESCAGTGLGLCRFEFQGANRQKLIVITADNEAQPILYRWWVE